MNIPAGRIAIIGILVIVGLLIYASFGGGQATSPKTTTPESSVPSTSTPTLHQIKQWAGIANKTTESFSIGAEPFEIKWSFTPDTEILGNYLGIQVIRVGDDWPVALPANIANVENRIEGSSYIYETGTFYLDIMSFSGQWTVEIIASN